MRVLQAACGKRRGGGRHASPRHARAGVGDAVEGHVPRHPLRQDDRTQLAHRRGQAWRSAGRGGGGDFRRALARPGERGGEPQDHGRVLRPHHLARTGRATRGDRHGEPREEPVRRLWRRGHDKQVPHDRRGVRHGTGDGPRPHACAAALRLRVRPLRRAEADTVGAYRQHRPRRQDMLTRTLHRRGAQLPHRSCEARAAEEHRLRRARHQKVRGLSRPVRVHLHMAWKQIDLPHPHGDGRRRGADRACAGSTHVRRGQGS